MFKSLLIVSLLFSISAAANERVNKFSSCFEKRADKVPSTAERELLNAYVNYFKNGSAKSGRAVIDKMLALKNDVGGKFSVKWVGLFEGAIELCCSSETSSCSESFGSISLLRILPRVEKGYATALEIVLLYSALAKTDGADASGLRDYQKIIKSKHPWAIRKFQKDHRALIKDFPVLWI